jgi:ubiquitin-protein ligase
VILQRLTRLSLPIVRMSLKNQRRLLKDLREAAELPGVGCCPKDGRLDLLFAHVSIVLDSKRLAYPLLVKLAQDYPLSSPDVGFLVRFPYHMVSGSPLVSIGCPINPRLMRT